MYTISGLSAATEYTVEVAAVNSVGVGVYSDPIVAMTDGEQPSVHEFQYVVCLSVCLSVCLCVCLSVCLSMSVCYHLYDVATDSVKH